MWWWFGSLDPLDNNWLTKKFLSDHRLEITLSWCVSLVGIILLSIQWIRDIRRSTLQASTPDLGNAWADIASVLLRHWLTISAIIAGPVLAITFFVFKFMAYSTVGHGRTRHGSWQWVPMILVIFSGLAAVRRLPIWLRLSLMPSQWFTLWFTMIGASNEWWTAWIWTACLAISITLLAECIIDIRHRFFIKA
jgi:hypothetical protein